MPKFSQFFGLKKSQHELDFVDVNNKHDIPVYVDPYAIEVSDDVWAAEASENIRTFFTEVLDALRNNDTLRAINLMSHLKEPAETFLGVSRKEPQGRGVGPEQSRQLINSIRKSKAYHSGLLGDLSEIALYVEGVDRDKVSDLTTNIIRNLLVQYTQQQCALLSVPTKPYIGPPMWDRARRNWVSRKVELPYVGADAVLLVPKYIVRRRLSLDGQEFYNKQLTDFLIAENIKANSSLVQTIKGKPKVLKKDVREQHPKTKSFIAETVRAHPELLELYKSLAKKLVPMAVFEDDDLSITTVCTSLAEMFSKIPPGAEHADDYHRLVMGSLTALFYPDLIQPHKEWEIHEGRKRVDIAFTNASDTGFFSQRRNDPKTNANVIVVECKNYSDDLGNEELDQLLGRFDDNRGKFGIIACRTLENPQLALKRCVDASSRSRGYILTLTDEELRNMLLAKARFEDRYISGLLFDKYRKLLT